MNLKTPIEEVPRISKIYGGRLRRLGIQTLGDLIFYFPYRYQDLTNIIPIKDVSMGSDACLQGKITSIKTNRIFRKGRKPMSITEAVLQDSSGSIRSIWFNQPYLEEAFANNQELVLAGEIRLDKSGVIISNPSYEKVKDTQLHVGRLVPVYSETKGITSKWIRYILHPLLDKVVPKLPETLPEEIVKQEGLVSIREAVRQIHFPDSTDSMKKARERLGYEELFLINLFISQQKQQIKESKGHSVPIDAPSLDEFYSSLDFSLTKAQKRELDIMLQEMAQNIPMTRLLQGDVGSGKTIVAATLLLNTALHNLQSVIMAPTEILAEQHFNGIAKLLSKFDLPIALLTSSQSKIVQGELEEDATKDYLLDRVRSGDVLITVGTHALIQDSVSFKNLALTVIDEQHRFGVEQRAKLKSKSKDTIPHLLSMTATPIPRSLALTIYGDLDLSIIDEMPKGRQEIKTDIIDPEERDGAYQLIRDEINKGRQAFVICPKISQDDSSKLKDVRSVEKEYQELSQNIFPDLEVDHLHGKMDPETKEAVMRRFQENKTNILVATSVIEVGVDIPNATAMIIEGAERFGLSQLHQMRGRIGRSIHQSYCLLFTTEHNPEVEERLQVLVESNDGFRIAESDMSLRGPGEFLGQRQTGVPSLIMASLTDTKLVERTKARATKILQSSSSLEEFPILKKRLKRFSKKPHLE